MKEQDTRNKEQGTENRAPAFVFTGVLLLSDQAVKHLFSDTVRAYCNPGGPLGAEVGNELMIGVMAVVLILAIAGSVYRKTAEDAGQALPHPSPAQGENTFHPRGSGSQLGFPLIIAGGLSNLVDRIIFGCVRDFEIVSWFPVFNPADVYLVLGVIAVSVGVYSQRND